MRTCWRTAGSGSARQATAGAARVVDRELGQAGDRRGTRRGLAVGQAADRRGQEALLPDFQLALLGLAGGQARHPRPEPPDLGHRRATDARHGVGHAQGQHRVRRRQGPPPGRGRRVDGEPAEDLARDRQGRGTPLRAELHEARPQAVQNIDRLERLGLRIGRRRVCRLADDLPMEVGQNLSVAAPQGVGHLRPRG